MIDGVYDAELADRVRALLSAEPGVDEQRMFGGLAFLVDRHLAVAASGQGGLMVRVDPAQAGELLEREHVAPVVMRGRETRGWLRVAAPGVDTDRGLADWVTRGVAWARSLPPKTTRRPGRR
jgi:hypothetical protein